MSNMFLEDEQNQTIENKGSFAKYELKIQHLNDLNKKIYIENEHLRLKIKKLEEQKLEFFKAHFNENSMISSLEEELRVQRQKNFQLSKKNEQFLANILLNEQLNVESRKQFDFYLARYEQKILELRQALQLKEVQIQSLEQKYEKFKGLSLPMSIKNANRYYSEMIKYEQLIEELIEERNKDVGRNREQIGNVLKHFEMSDAGLKNLKPKKDKLPKNTASHTDIRPKMCMLTEDSQDTNINTNKLEVIFLRLHLQLRELKKKYVLKIQQNIQLQNKDKIMKQGYLTLTKEMEKIKIENCQLKIQLQHMDKKIKTSKEISYAKSTGNISRQLRFKQNIESKVSSDVSIQGNLQDAKQNLKINLPSQTKYDTFSASKSHNFDQQIENIEGILSHDSNPDFSHFKSRKQIIEQKEQNADLSICEQKQVDMSISLNTSGFMPANKSHHQINDDVLEGLIDERVF